MRKTFDALAREIEELEKRLRSISREAPADVELPTRWSYDGGVLRWHVLLVEEVLEPDVDVEITSVAIIVRARAARKPSRILLGVLPVPGTFDLCQPEIRFETNSLEIRLRRMEGDSF